MRRAPVTQDDINRWKGQGLGQGEGAAYRPWIDVRSFSSKGRCSRAPGITTGRIHHVFSDNEDDVCLMADFAKNIVAIHEQFPLFPEEHTQRIATCLGIRHPRYPNSKTPLVLTTDFFLTRTNNQGIHSPLAVSVKSADDLRGCHCTRTLAKLEIERRYWLMRSVPWLLITDEDLNETLIANLDWLNYVVVESNLTPQMLSKLLPVFLSIFG
ncbi:MAG TPA: TnsA endonuclease N-terminal domain-containing protein, partial [Burkholderiaceae bacterium]